MTYNHLIWCNSWQSSRRKCNNIYTHTLTAALSFVVGHRPRFGCRYLQIQHCCFKHGARRCTRDTSVTCRQHTVTIISSLYSGNTLLIYPSFHVLLIPLSCCSSADSHHDCEASHLGVQTILLQHFVTCVHKCHLYVLGGSQVSLMVYASPTWAHLHTQLTIPKDQLQAIKTCFCSRRVV